MLLTIIVIIYLFIVGFLGWKGYKATQTAADYLIAGRGVHPYIMALSYGATFISTSAIIGFGGAAGVFGLGLLWLTFLNIFVGVFISFLFLGTRTRKMGHQLNAHTFPEFLGKRYQSKFVQIFSGSIVLTMVLYAAVVLIGAARYLEKTFHINFDVALMLFSLIIIAYVIAGGLKGVMYSDAFQGTIMFIGMALLLVLTFTKIGGVTESHKKLGDLHTRAYNIALVDLKSAYEKENPGSKITIEKTAQVAPYLGRILWQSKGKSPEIASKIADKQLALALLKTQINLKLTYKKIIADMKAKSAKTLGNFAALSKFKDLGHQGWGKMPKSGSPFWWLLVSTILMGVGIGVLAQPQLAVRFMTVRSKRELNRAILIGGVFILLMTAVAFIVGALSNVYFFEIDPKTKGAIAVIAAKGNSDMIMPTFLNDALPSWFNYVFMLTLLSAAMSTLSSQFHAMGTAISRDIFEASGAIKEKSGKKSILATKAGIGIMIIITVILGGYVLPKGYIAAGTALFFGLCAAAFIPAYVGGLYWKKATKAGAIASIVSGFATSLFWLLLVHVFTVSKWGGKSILGKSALSMVDPIFIALPISILVYIIVSLSTQKPSQEHINHCFKDIA